MTSADFSQFLEPVAAHFLNGRHPYNPALSKQGKELRYGNHGSLSLDLTKGTWHNHETGEGGGVLDFMRVYGGMDKAEAVKWLKEQRFIEGDAPKPAAKTPAKTPAAPKPKIVATYDYKDASGNFIYQSVRFEPKRFLQRRPDSKSKDGWAWNLDGIERLLYRLPELVASASSGQPVFIVEGEKDANRLASLGLTATTNSEGAKLDGSSWPKHCNQYLAGRDVVIIPDNDGVGRAHAGAVANSLRGIAGTIRILHLADLPEKGDVSDYLESHSKDDLLALVAALEFWHPVKSEKQAPSKPVAVPAKPTQNFPTTWGAPGEITAPLKEVPAFDAMALLPDSIRNWVLDQADRMPCPPDFVAASVMVELGAVIGARCAIKPKKFDDWCVVPNLWGGIVGNPASKKSPAISSAMKPLDRLAALEDERYTQRHLDWLRKAEIYEIKKESIKAKLKKTQAAGKTTDDGLDALSVSLYDGLGEKPEQPRKRRYKSNDSTIEKLGAMLEHNTQGLMVLRDELVGLLASLDKEGREGDRAFYLESWNGSNSFNTDRIGRGEIQIPNLCLSVFGGIQPDKLIGYLEQLNETFTNDGLVQRFQVLVYPDSTPWEWRDRKPAKEERDRVYALFEALADLDPVAWGAEPQDDYSKFPTFRFTTEAQELFIEWSTDLYQTIEKEDNPLLSQHFSKYEKLFCSLALIFHLIESLDKKTQGDVTLEAAMRAAAWCDYLGEHARRCYGLLLDNGLRSAQALAEKIKTGKLKDGFTAREVRLHQWKYLTNEEAVTAALDWLEDENWIQGTETKGNGRPTVRYAINPTLERKP